MRAAARALLRIGSRSQTSSGQHAPVAQWSTVLFGEPKSSGLSSRRPRVRFPPGALSGRIDNPRAMGVRSSGTRGRGRGRQHCSPLCGAAVGPPPGDSFLAELDGRGWPNRRRRGAWARMSRPACQEQRMLRALHGRRPYRRSHCRHDLHWLARVRHSQGCWCAGGRAHHVAGLCAGSRRPSGRQLRR